MYKSSLLQCGTIQGTTFFKANMLKQLKMLKYPCRMVRICVASLTIFCTDSTMVDSIYHHKQNSSCVVGIFLGFTKFSNHGQKGKKMEVELPENGTECDVMFWIC